MEQLAIWVTSVETDHDTKAIFRPSAEAILEYISVEKLRESMTRTCNALTAALADIQAVGRFRLKEITISVEISAEGGVQLIGTANMGGKGAISMTFLESQ